MFDNKDISSLTMVGKILLICLVVAFAGHSLSIFEAHHQSSHIFNGRYKLQADNGEFLTLCLTGCGPTASSGTPVAAIRSEDCANSVWKIENNGAGYFFSLCLIYTGGPYPSRTYTAECNPAGLICTPI